MHKCMIACILLCAIFQFTPLNAQNAKSSEINVMYYSGDTIILPHQAILPGSMVTSTKISMLWADYYAGKFIFDIQDSVFLNIRYRWFPDFLAPEYALRKFVTHEDSADLFIRSIGFSRPVSSQELFEVSRIRRSGSISRGVTGGSNRDVAVTSGLRLQLEGYVTDDIEIIAAITDENIPIQPDGSTQQLNDFDKVYIQLKKQESRLTLGDFEINRKGTQFADFYRNVQGVGLDVKHKSVEAGISGAVAKGKFHSNSFQGENGRQGPYRLNGKAGERFIIVLAGSEKVYVNGQLMVRGEGNDYTIDYNTGELTFTTQRVITNISRIVVDFEYSDRFYNRSLIFSYFKDRWLDDKLHIQWTYGREADNHRAPIDPFNDAQRQVLRNAGDNPFAAAFTGIDSASTSTTEIRYVRRDTSIAGITYERYVYAPNDPEAIFKLSFSSVGAGNGYYRRSGSEINGTIFQWSPPDEVTGLLTGDFEPISILPLPGLLHVNDLILNYEINDHIEIFTETALSVQDNNRFSPLDDQDNRGWANRSGIRGKQIKLNSKIHLNTEVSQKYVSARYQNIDRIYKMEYGRDWNFNDLGIRKEEKVTEGFTEMITQSGLKLKTGGGVRFMGNDTRSIRQIYEAGSSHKWLQGTYTMAHITTQYDSLGLTSNWQRHNGDIFKKFGKWQPGAEIWIENKKDIRNDSLRSGSFQFTDLKPYLRTIDTEKLKLDISYNFRRDFEFRDSALLEKAIAHTQFYKWIYAPGDRFTFQNTTTYRDFILKNEIFSDEGLGNSKILMNNFQNSFSTPNRLLSTSLIYEVTSQRLARREIRYIETTAGFGQYEWKDFNENGLQELNEFVISYDPARANFVRLLVPSQELFPTIGLNMNSSVRTEFKKVFKKTKNPFTETLRNFSTVSNFRTEQRKESLQGLQTYLLKFGDFFGDTSLLNALYTFRQDIYFFRNSPGGEVSFSFLDNQSRLFLTSGDENRSSKNWQTRQRINFSKSISIENALQTGSKKYSAMLSDPRNFNIQFYSINPILNRQFNPGLRWSWGLDYTHKENLNDSMIIDTKVQFMKAISELKVNFKDRNNLFLKAEFIRITQAGEANASANYEILESFQKGNNVFIQAFATWYLTASLELSINYDLRASQGNRPLHAGRMQVRALF